MLALVAVLPLLLSGHVHGSTEAVAHPCAICVVVHHAPASGTTPVALHATLELSPSTWKPETPRVAQCAPSIRSVRAPPPHDPPLSV